MLLVILLARPGTWAQGGESAPEAVSSHRLEQLSHIAVHQERLSVELREMEVGEVLAQIAQQAGIPITARLRTETRVSASFTDMALDAGLRHLLRLASLSHAMRYARGPTGAVVLTEVRVFEEAPGESRLAQPVAEPAVENRSTAAGDPPVATFIQALRAFPQPIDDGVPDVTQPFRAQLDGAPLDAPLEGMGGVSALIRHFQEALEDPR